LSAATKNNEEDRVGDVGWLERVEHTADEGVVVHAGGLRELFERAAWGMFACIADMERVRPHREVPVAVDAADREALLVQWLSELNRIHQTDGMLFCEFSVSELDDHRLRAAARGEPIDPKRHDLFLEVKGVTYHGLAIEETSGGWTARILFDV